MGRKNQDIHLILRDAQQLDRPPGGQDHREIFHLFVFNSVVGRLLFIVTHLSPGWVEFRILNLQVKSAMCCTFLMTTFKVGLSRNHFHFTSSSSYVNLFFHFLLHARILEISQILKRICTTHSLIHTKTLHQYIQIEYFYIDV